MTSRNGRKHEEKKKRNGKHLSNQVNSECPFVVSESADLRSFSNEYATHKKIESQNMSLQLRVPGFH
jgi:hypothetical protein